MLNQKKVEIFLVKIRKSLAKQFLEIALSYTKIRLQYTIEMEILLDVFYQKEARKYTDDYYGKPAYEVGAPADGFFTSDVSTQHIAYSVDDGHRPIHLSVYGKGNQLDESFNPGCV